MASLPRAVPALVSLIEQETAESSPITGLSQAAVVDPSGGMDSSFMTLAVTHMEGERAMLDAVREIHPPFSPESATSDRYAGERPRERFYLHGVRCDLSEQPESDNYRNLLPILIGGRGAAEPDPSDLAGVRP